MQKHQKKKKKNTPSPKLESKRKVESKNEQLEIYIRSPCPCHLICSSFMINGVDKIEGIENDENENGDIYGHDGSWVAAAKIL